MDESEICKFSIHVFSLNVKQIDNETELLSAQPQAPLRVN